MRGRSKFTAARTKTPDTTDVLHAPDTSTEAGATGYGVVDRHTNNATRATCGFSGEKRKSQHT